MASNLRLQLQENLPQRLKSGLPPPPFDRLAADVVLQSSDRVNFYVYQPILLLASGFFETMFSLKQPTPEAADASPARPLIEVTEDSETLDALLRCFYPIDDPSIPTLGQLEKVLEAADKYDIHVAVNALRRILLTFVPAYPREVFGVASRHALEEEAQTAAQAWKGIVSARAISERFEKTFAGATFIPAMSNTNAGAYHGLLLYLHSGHLPPRFCSPLVPLVPVVDGLVASTTSSFSARDGDIILACSQDGHSFKVHRLILAINNLDVLLADASPVAAVDSIPAYQVPPDITSDILETLLLLCYPDGYAEEMYHGSILWNTYSRLMEIATKYKMYAVIRTLRRNWPRDVVHDPLAFYCIAARYGWLAEAQEAAELLLEAPLDDVYSPELETLTAAGYQSLLKFHHLYRTTAMQNLRKHGTARISPYASSIDVSNSRDGWRNGWLGDPNSSGKYLRNVPYILLELHSRVYKNTGELSFQKITTEAQAVEDTIKQAVQNIRVEFESFE